MDQSPAQPAATAAVPENTGEGAHPLGADVDLQAYAGFDGALRGYDRRQVNKYVTRAQKRIEDLAAELATVRRNEQVLATRVDELTKHTARCTCDPDKPESAVVGARLRQIIDIASADADDLRSRAEAESTAMREEAENALVIARQQAEQATSALEAMLAHRRAAEEAAEAERRAALEGWAERHVNEARETARRVVERAGAVSSQVIASARWLVDALGAHRDALAEQLGGVQRRIDELPSLDAAAAVAAENLLRVPAGQPAVSAASQPSQPAVSAENRAAVPAGEPAVSAENRAAVPAGESAVSAASQPAARTPAGDRPDEASQPIRGVVRMPGAHAAPDDAPPGTAPEDNVWGTESPPSAGSVARPPAHAAPADTATLNRTWTPVDPRIGGGTHRG